MTAPDAAGQRLITAGTFLWLSEVAAILREQLGPAARKVPRRRVPNMLVRVLALFDPEIRSVVGDRVHVEMTPYDLTKGRLVYREKTAGPGGGPPRRGVFRRR